LDQSASSTSLLHYVRQFMGEKSFSIAGVRRIPALTKNNMFSDGVGIGIQIPGRSLRLGAGVHAHIRKIMSETRLHKRANIWIERMSRRSQDRVDVRWHSHDTRVARDLPLNQAAALARSTGTGGLVGCQAYYIFCDAVSFLFASIVTPIDRETGPDRGSDSGVHGYTVRVP
jgi:hypothetical protein